MKKNGKCKELKEKIKPLIGPIKDASEHTANWFAWGNQVLVLENIVSKQCREQCSCDGSCLSKLKQAIEDVLNARSKDWHYQAWTNEPDKAIITLGEIYNSIETENYK